MTTIEKQQFKITIPSIISIITCTIAVITTLYSLRDQGKADLEDVKSEVQQIKATQRISNESTFNQLTVLSNKLDVESNDRKIGQQEIKEEIKDQSKEFQSFLMRFINKQTVTDNQ